MVRREGVGRFPISAPVLLGTGIVTLLLAVYLQRNPLLDFQIEDLFWNATTQSFIIPPEDPLLKLLFYTGAKNLVIAISVGVLFRMIFLFWKKRKAEAHAFLAAVICLAVIPAIATPMKAHTQVSCPSELTQYGGGLQFEQAIFSLKSLPGGRCFPAGHASGGFALMALAFIPKSRRLKNGFLLLGFIFGNLMGGYQMIRGAHFMSHTLATIGIALLVLGAVAFFRERSVRILSDSP